VHRYGNQHMRPHPSGDLRHLRNSPVRELQRSRSPRLPPRYLPYSIHDDFGLPSGTEYSVTGDSDHMPRPVDPRRGRDYERNTPMKSISLEPTTPVQQLRLPI